MKRSDFLKRLGIGLGAVVVAPRVLAEMPTKEEKKFPKVTTAGELDPIAFTPRRMSTHVKVSGEFNSVWDTQLDPTLFDKYVKYYSKIPLKDFLFK